MSQPRAALLLARASCANSWASLSRSAGNSLPLGFLAPCAAAMAILVALFVQRALRMHLSSVEDSDPDHVVAAWIVLLGLFACLGSGLLCASGTRAPSPPAHLRMAPLDRRSAHVAWCTPRALFALGLAFYLSVPIALALGDWLHAEAGVVARLVVTMTSVLVVATLLGLALWAVIARFAVRTILGRRRFLVDMAAATGHMAVCALAALWTRTPAAERVLRSIGRELVTPGSVLPPWSALSWILAGLGLGLPGWVLLSAPDASDSGAGSWLRSKSVARKRNLVTLARLDLCLWCRERQGLALALVAQVFWVLLCVYCVAESSDASAGIAQPVDLVRLRESVNYVMPIGWAFFSTLSLGLTYRGGRQVLGAPVDLLELVWRRFIAALAFSAVQWVFCSVSTGIALGSLGIPPGLSVIAALFVLANACAFVAGILIPVDKGRLQLGLGALQTSMLALFAFLLSLAFVFVPSYAFVSGAFERSIVQVLLSFALVALLIKGASKAGRAYGLAR